MATNPEDLRLPNRRVVETYKKEFTEQELAALRSEFTSESFELSELKAEMKKVVDELKAEIKEKEAIVARLLPIAKHGYEIVTGEVNTHYDDESGIVEYYSIEDGTKVGERKQRMEEKLPLFTSN